LHQIQISLDSTVPFGVCTFFNHSSSIILQEAIVIPPWVALAIRPRPGVWEYVRVNVSELAVEELRVPEYLQFKEQLVEEGYDFCSPNNNFD
jgi:hypothetical protein